MTLPKAEIRRRAEERLKELKLRKIEIQKKMIKYREDNRLEFFDTPPNPGPNPKQQQLIEAFLDRSYKTLGMSGGNRLGKTTILTILGLSCLFGKLLWNNQSIAHLFPHKKARKIRYVGQNWQDHIKAVVIPEIEKWWPKNRPVQRHGNGVITDTYWKDTNTGSSIEIMSNNQKTKEHEGWEGDLILYDEPCHREIYVANARGLVDRQGREIFAATLLSDPWIDREIVKKVDANGKPAKDVYWIHGTSYDNVGYGITKEGVDEFSAKLTDEERRARIEGIPEYMSGLVYADFNRRLHCVDRFEVPLDWMVDIGIDIHPREKQAVLFVATDPRNDRYVCDEIWDHGDGTWVAEQIIKRITRNNYRVNQIIIDPLSKGDSNNDRTVFQKIFEVLSRYGYDLGTAVKDKDAGILDVKNHLMGPNKRPSMFFFNDLVRTIYEMEGYMWDKNTNKPLDKDDHMCENLYRIVLLNTRYEDPSNGFYEEYLVDDGVDNRNSHTGY